MAFSLKKGATARVSEDFCPNEPTFQTLHIATVAFVSLLLGEIVVPDWDMFYVRLVNPVSVFYLLPVVTERLMVI